MAGMPEKRALIREAAFTALFAVVATVSVVALVETAARPFGRESFSLVHWALFGVTMAGASAALVRSLRYYASLAALRRVMPDSSAPHAPAAERGRIWERVPPVLDDASWVVVACFIATINVLALLAAVHAVGDLAGESDVAVGWLIWQLAVLLACSAALTRFTLAAARELWDRARRRRRNAIHTVTGRLLHWTGERRTSSPARRTVSCALTGALAAIAWVTGSGPLLDVDRSRPAGQAMGGAPGSYVARARPPGGDASGRERPLPARRTDGRGSLERAATDAPAVAAAPAVTPIARRAPAIPRRAPTQRPKPDRRAPRRRPELRAPEDGEPAPDAPPPGTPPAPAPPGGDAPPTTPAPPAEPPARPPGGGMVPCPEALPPEVAGLLPPCGGISAESRREAPAELMDTPRP